MLNINIVIKMNIILQDLCMNCNNYYEWNNKDLCEVCYINQLEDINCGGNCQKLCSNEKCKKCYLKSFASHEKSRYWSNNNKLTPREVFKSSGTKYIFKCGDCEHSFESGLNNITKNFWCPFCPNQKLCQNKECKTCYEKSFASHPKSKYWSIKNKDLPRDVFKSSGTKYIFDCYLCNHEYEGTLNNITNGNNWCSCTVNKTEKEILDIIRQKYPNVIHQFKTEWCRNIITNNFLPFDYCVEENKVIGEVDGRQHFENVKYWKNDYLFQIKRDCVKMKKSLENGFSIIRISQVNYLKDRNKILIDKFIELLSIKRNTPEIIYLSLEEKLYDKHKEMMIQYEDNDSIII